jgi:hypothetical protein
MQSSLVYRDKVTGRLAMACPSCGYVLTWHLGWYLPLPVAAAKKAAGHECQMRNTLSDSVYLNRVTATEEPAMLETIEVLNSK